MDDLYPNNGAYFASISHPIQDEERAKEEAEVRTSAPTLQKAIDRLIERADFYESINAIDDSVLVNPDEFMHVVAGNKLAAQSLRSEAAYLTTLLEEYAATK